ncbi:MAG: MipA/OmpV family protein [Pseudomonadota bacterium]
MLRLSLLLASSTTLTLTAIAQERPDLEGWRVTVGAGSLYAPTYEGDDDYALSVLPNIQVRYADTFSASVQNGLRYNIVNTDQLTIGPLARVQFAREEDGDQPFAISGNETNDLVGLGDVDTTFELGGYLSYRTGPLELGIEARQGVNGHEGLVADLRASVRGRSFAFGPPIIWSAGPRLRLVDDSYNSAYFGVTQEQSIASGLDQYNADGGIYSFGLGATAIIPFDRSGKWSVVAIAGYDQLTGDIADAPLVVERGSEDQFTLGVFLSRAF